MTKIICLRERVESDLLDLLARDIDAHPEKLHYPSQGEIDEVMALVEGVNVDIDTLEVIEVDTTGGVSN
ncbi:hypothetical protein EDB59_4278 [Vibrio crassostreae]|uniref:hypothetical protein n=1 Tax=Vibrio crassostreae TaxID=246167 RepID=UPI00067E6D45|nr:hypothetical protein [Vibrio crassostreae]KNH10767.1 hypothetical protein ACS79_20645 [Vibrio lentus]ROR60256.1 hypothetical protein EDB59_4278 [Vibrio crassostreae]